MILGEKSLRIFGTNVAVCRKNKGMTQEELCCLQVSDVSVPKPWASR